MNKKGTGFLVWATVLAFMTIYPFFLSPIEYYEGITVGDYAGARTITSASLGMKLFSIIGGIISISLCYLFYRIAKNRSRRRWFAKIPGYFFCALGTAYPYFGTSQFARASFLKTRGFEENGSYILILSLVLTVVFCAVAYILIFKTKNIDSETEPSIKTNAVN